MALSKAPTNIKVAAVSQWLLVSLAYIPCVVSGIFMGAIAALTARPMTNKFGESTQEHRDKYKELGSRGVWEYWASPYRFIRLWSNYEDGDLGEPSGKQSARCRGNERSFWNRYKWLSFRNPFNMGKRTLPLFRCLVNDCTIEYWGDKTVNGKSEDFGSQLVLATDLFTDKKYYGFRRVTKIKGSDLFWDIQIGFKVKPSHSGVIQDADDEDKAFSISIVKTNWSV